MGEAELGIGETELGMGEIQLGMGEKISALVSQSWAWAR